MKTQDILNCKFSNWYPLYQQQTIRSLIIPLPDDFVSYLKDNGSVVLPKGVKFRVEQKHSDEDSQEISWEENDETVEEEEFPELIKEIIEAMQQLGGKVFPKMGWSAPRDASWINNNTLQCTTPGEIILLLKSSDFIQFDLLSIFQRCDDISASHHNAMNHELVLRKWANLLPGMEFRCFVYKKQLIAISQRDHKLHYNYIEQEKESLSKEIHDFVMERVINIFPSSDFVVDLYKKRNGNYWIIDFNPFGEMTDPLLFTWNELAENKLVNTTASFNLIKKDGSVAGQFRYTDSATTLQPNEYLSCGIPVDFVDLSTGADATKLIDFMRMKIQNDDESSEGENDEWKLPT